MVWAILFSLRLFIDGGELKHGSPLRKMMRWRTNGEIILTRAESGEFALVMVFGSGKDGVDMPRNPQFQQVKRIPQFWLQLVIEEVLGDSLIEQDSIAPACEASQEISSMDCDEGAFWDAVSSKYDNKVVRGFAHDLGIL